MLREEHPVFHSPDNVQFSAAKEIDVPDAWKHGMTEATIRVLPLVKNPEGQFRDGWCTYTYEHLQAPELEIICGGINAKTHKASAIWRQGNLLHFGFEQSPAEMNDNGNSLLVNSISYIARFGQDRPIIRRSSDGRILDRSAIDRLINNKDRDLKPYLSWFFPAGDLRDELGEMTREELSQWYQQWRGFLSADRRGKFFLDQQAKELGIATDDIEFIPAAIADLQSDGVEKERAQELLNRYVPSVPSDTSVKEWQAWWDENRDFLFFSDTGGFQWYIDPLAKQRKKSPKELTGQARADES